jgi:hypothetical protein
MSDQFGPENLIDTHEQALYEALSAPFDETFQLNDLTYITGEQAITRLTENLGVFGWSFEVKHSGVNAEADEVWVHGRLEANFNGRAAVREQFGGAKIKRSRSSGIPIGIGDDFKAAATDSLKKCAQNLSVGLYLAHKDPQAQSGGFQGQAQGANGQQRQGGGQFTPPSAPPQNSPDGYACAECGKVLEATNFRDGTTWPPSQLAGYGQRKHNRVLCMEHYRAANEAKRRNERQGQDAMQEVPF